jgi:hypothetical protein
MTVNRSTQSVHALAAADALILRSSSCSAAAAAAAIIVVAIIATIAADIAAAGVVIVIAIAGGVFSVGALRSSLTAGQVGMSRVQVQWVDARVDAGYRMYAVGCLNVSTMCLMLGWAVNLACYYCLIFFLSAVN